MKVNTKSLLLRVICTIYINNKKLFFKVTKYQRIKLLQPEFRTV